jgi:hypothetical protein
MVYGIWYNDSKIIQCSISIWHLLDFSFLSGFSEMAASSSECGRHAAGLHAAAAEFGNAHHQRPGSAELYRQTGSLVGHRNDPLSLLFFE